MTRDQALRAMADKATKTRKVQALVILYPAGVWACSADPTYTQNEFYTRALPDGTIQVRQPQTPK